MRDLNIFKILKIRNLKKLWKNLSNKEKIWFAVFVILLLFSVSFLIDSFYRSKTMATPTFGGSYIEAVSESPHNINPILSTNDADRDLSRLIFSSLLKYNEAGILVPDLAASYGVSKDGKTYTIKLKENIYWHDGEPFNSSDVVFTINAVQNPEYASPQRTGWQGVKTEAPDKNTVLITLKTPYSSFIENLAFMGILPQHVWNSVLPQNFPLADFNLKPMGTGPYRFAKLQKDALGRITSVSLTANNNYFGAKPLIENITFKYYASEEEAVSAFNRKEVDGVFLQTAQNKNQLRGLQNSTLFSLPSYRVYGLFLNTDDPVLKDKNVRLAINYAVNRGEIIDKILNGEGKAAVGPLPPGAPGSSPDLAGYDFNPEKTAEILGKAGWTKNSIGIFQKKLSSKDKEPSPLKFTILTTKSIQLAATLISDQLKKAGIDTELKILSVGELRQNYVKTKNFEAVLIGESYTGAVDPYAFWHGATIKDPGLNLSLYNNSKVNKTLEDARQIFDPVKKAAKLLEFQKLVLTDAPAVFIYSPNYVYAMKDSVKNVNLKNLIIPSNRFAKISDWYIQTERILK